MFPSDDADRPPWYSGALRSALFPLVLIVLLVYLASQTLLPTEDGTDEIAYSEAKSLIRQSPDEIESAAFRPKNQELELTMRDGRRLETNYPSDASAVALEEELDRGGVGYDSAGTGESAWWSFLTYMLPFVLFFGFWIFLMNRMRTRRGDDGSGDGPS